MAVFLAEEFRKLCDPSAEIICKRKVDIMGEITAKGHTPCCYLCICVYALGSQ